jgi:hypothetical protein
MFRSQFVKSNPSISASGEIDRLVTRTRQGSAEKRHATSIDLFYHRTCQDMTPDPEPLHSKHGCPSQTGAICRLLSWRLDASTAQPALRRTGDDGKSTGNLRTKVARHRRNQLIHGFARLDCLFIKVLIHQSRRNSNIKIYRPVQRTGLTIAQHSLSSLLQQHLLTATRSTRLNRGRSRQS